MSGDAAVSDLSSHLGYWLRFVSNHVSQGFAAKLASRDVTVAEWVMLRSLWGQGAVAPSRLAAAMGMTRGAITRLAGRLIAKRLVARKSNPDDSRAQTLRLTPAGEALVPDLAALADRNDEEFFAPLSMSERSTLEALLRKIVEHGQLKGVPTE